MQQHYKVDSGTVDLQSNLLVPSEEVLTYEIFDDLPLAVLRGLEEQAAAPVGHKVHQFRGPVIRTYNKNIFV